MNLYNLLVTVSTYESVKEPLQLPGLGAAAQKLTGAQLNEYY